MFFSLKVTSFVLLSPVEVPGTSCVPPNTCWSFMYKDGKVTHVNISIYISVLRPVGCQAGSCYFLVNNQKNSHVNCCIIRLERSPVICIF